jgi:hypothetical protein
MRRTDIKKKIRELYKQRDEILYAKHDGANVEMAVNAISDIEYKIAALEDMLDFENRMLPFKLMLYGFIATVIGLLIWAFIASI